MKLQHYNGSVNYPTYFAREWLVEREPVADNRKALTSLIKRGGLCIAELRNMFLQALEPVLNKRSSPMARELLSWAIGKIHWQEIIEDVHLSLLEKTHREGTASRPLMETKQERVREQYFQGLPANNGFVNEPTAIAARWLATDVSAFSWFSNHSPMAAQREAVALKLLDEVSDDQSKCAFATRLLNWVLTLVDSKEIAGCLCDNPAAVRCADSIYTKMQSRKHAS